MKTSVISFTPTTLSRGPVWYTRLYNFLFFLITCVVLYIFLFRHFHIFMSQFCIRFNNWSRYISYFVVAFDSLTIDFYTENN